MHFYPRSKWWLTVYVLISQDPPVQTNGVKGACLCWSTVKILCQEKQPGQDRWAGISSVPLTTGCLYPRQTKRQLWCDTCSPAGLADFTVDLLSPVCSCRKHTRNSNSAASLTTVMISLTMMTNNDECSRCFCCCVTLVSMCENDKSFLGIMMFACCVSVDFGLENNCTVF